MNSKVIVSRMGMYCPFTFFTIVCNVRSIIRTDCSNIDVTRSFPGYPQNGIEYTTTDME